MKFKTFRSGKWSPIRAHTVWDASFERDFWVISHWAGFLSSAYGIGQRSLADPNCLAVNLCSKLSGLSCPKPKIFWGLFLVLQARLFLFSAKTLEQKAFSLLEGHVTRDHQFCLHLLNHIHRSFDTRNQPFDSSYKLIGVFLFFVFFCECVVIIWEKRKQTCKFVFTCSQHWNVVFACTRHTINTNWI